MIQNVRHATYSRSTTDVKRHVRELVVAISLSRRSYILFWNTSVVDVVIIIYIPRSNKQINLNNTDRTETCFFFINYKN